MSLHIWGILNSAFPVPIIEVLQHDHTEGNILRVEAFILSEAKASMVRDRNALGAVARTIVIKLGSFHPCHIYNSAQSPPKAVPPLCMSKPISLYSLRSLHLLKQ